MRFLLCLVLIGFCACMFIQNIKHEKVEKLYIEAKELERKNNNDPYKAVQLKQALTLYKQCLRLSERPEYIVFLSLVKYTIILFNKKEILKEENTVFRDGKKCYKQAVDRCQRKIDNYRKFHDFVDLAREQVKEKHFKQALANFLKADAICFVDRLEAEIIECKDNIKHQENYEKDLKQSARIASQGRFQEALDILKPIVNKFPRQDGQQLLAKLERVKQAKGLYNLGLFAEEKSNLEEARTKYEKALDLLPEFTECKIRLSILAIKQKPQQAIYYLQALEGEQASYIRGFAYAQLGNWQQADREWRSISQVSVEVIQRPMLKRLAERDRLNSIREIEKLLDRGQIETAKSVSIEFIKKFGSDTVVKFNLENHIQPILEKSNWNNRNWQKTVTKLEQIWLEQQDAKSLHNWAIATYYQAQTNPHKLITDFIIAWSTALANLDSNPILKNVSWLGSNSINIENVSTKLKQILENAIDAVKDSNINEYLRLRDVYRREMLASSLIKQDNCGVRIKQQLFVLPGCYQRFRDRIPKTKLPANLWGALYTDWGLAVAAGHEGDTARAVKIKPSKKPASESDRFAHCFVSYHEGCYYLQNLEWQKAVKPLEQAKPEIKAKSDWCKKIDELCEAQRQKIGDSDEHRRFSQFWYDLTSSQSASSYFAECKAREVAKKLANETISSSQGLNELREIQKIDRNNPIILELIKTVQTVLESEKIDRLLQNGQFEEAVRAAKRSSNEEIRFRVAELCLEIIIKQIQQGNLSYEAIQALNNIAQWAYELCPREPAFQPVFRQLREIGIGY